MNKNYYIMNLQIQTEKKNEFLYLFIICTYYYTFSINNKFIQSLPATQNSKRLSNRSYIVSLISSKIEPFIGINSFKFPYMNSKSINSMQQACQSLLAFAQIIRTTYSALACNSLIILLI